MSGKAKLCCANNDPQIPRAYSFICHSCCRSFKSQCSSTLTYFLRSQVVEKPSLCSLGLTAEERRAWDASAWLLSLLVEAGHIARLYLIGQECIILFQREAPNPENNKYTVPAVVDPKRLGALRAGPRRWVTLLRISLKPEQTSSTGHPARPAIGLSDLFCMFLFLKLSPPRGQFQTLSGRAGRVEGKGSRCSLTFLTRISAWILGSLVVHC